MHEKRDANIFGRETRRITGPERMREKVGGTSFLVSPTAFYFLCGVRHDPTSMDNSLLASAYRNDEVDAAQTATWNPVVFEKDARLVGGTIRLPGGGGGDSTITCRGTSDDPVNTQTTQVNSSLRPQGLVGLRTFGATASFDYIFIVDKAAAPAAVQ
jgi:hypothetical protein